MCRYLPALLNWGLRDYGVNGQIGLEDSMEAFISEMVGVFREVWRVLRDDGTCWLNLGDTYNNFRSSGYIAQSVHNGEQRGKDPDRRRGDVALKEKDLCGIPWRVALALQADGWYLRSDIIWAKKSPMPESCRDRCTKSHEYVFMLTKEPQYWYDQLAIAEPLDRPEESERKTPALFGGADKHKEAGKQSRLHSGNEYNGTATGTRNKRDVWWISTESFKGAHFATFPKKLVEPCILAGCPEVCCSECGAGHVRILEKKRRPTRPGENTKTDAFRNSSRYENNASFDNSGGLVVGNRDPERHVTETVTVGWEPSCECNAETAPGVVLDPFGGSGTTGEVAKDLGRRFILCELNAEYVKLMQKRLKQGALC